jgi:hypothetical protein
MTQDDQTVAAPPPAPIDSPEQGISEQAASIAAPIAAEQPETGTAPGADQPSAGASSQDAPHPNESNLGGNEPDQTAPSGGDTVAGDPAEEEYEADRLAAVDKGDTSWPTWGFLPLNDKMAYIDKLNAKA